jgi:hypothetical protein
LELRIKTEFGLLASESQAALPPCLTSIQRLAGDLPVRSGALLLADIMMEHDSTVTIASIASTSAGRKKLSSLTGAIRRLFAPIIYQAHLVVANALATESHQSRLQVITSISDEIETNRDDSSEDIIGIAAMWQVHMHGWRCDPFIRQVQQCHSPIEAYRKCHLYEVICLCMNEVICLCSNTPRTSTH